MASALIEELKTVATEAKRSRTLLVEAEEGGGGGVGEGE